MVLNSNKNNETIVAQCTPSGVGALAIIRITGENALDIATPISSLASKKLLRNCTTHTIHYGFVTEIDGTVIDSVLFLLMKAPKTFTGQDTVEISCHNNPFIIERIINRAIQAGARLAQSGEFSQRAFLHGKVDLLQAEAINELIHANHQLSLRQSLAQLEGSFSAWVTKLEEQLVKALAFSEASFEFIDEELTFAPRIQEILESVLKDIDICKKTYDQQQHIRQGIRIALLGCVNAGKSSLFNALLKQKRSIVTDIAGTTRDAIEAGLYVEGNYWTLIDTAGLRKTEDIIEQEGIKRSIEEAQKADLIILIYDGSRAMTEEENKVYTHLLNEFSNKCILIANKIDLPYKSDIFLKNKISLQTSLGDPASIDALYAILQQKISTLFASIESPFLLNKRHYQLLINVELKLQAVFALLNEKYIAYELVSCHLQDTLENLSELSGKSISEKGMDAVFRQFCVGK